MARLPQPGGDRGSWGNVLNDFLSVEHNADGTLKDSATLGAYAPLNDPVFSGNVTVPVPTSPTDAVTKAYADDLVSSGVADASTVAKGKLQLAGDLAGNADTPLVAAGAITDAKVSGSANIAQTKIANLTTDLAAKETPAGAQAKVDTHAGASDPHGDRAYTNTQLSSYATRANPTFTGTVTVPTPSNNTDAATKAYVDSTASAGTPDANNSTKGKIQLTGDLAGSADIPLVAAQAIDNSKVSNTAAIAQSKIANLTTDLGAKAPLNNPTFTGVVTVPTPSNNTDATTKLYVDNTVSAGTPDANNVTKGKLQLAGDLAGTATTPVIAAGAIDNAKVNASAAIAQSKIANLTTDLAAKETPAGAQAKVDTHVAATDPHGDRSYTDTQIGTINTITPGPGLYMDDLGGNIFELGFDGSMYTAGTGIAIADNGDGTYTLSNTSTGFSAGYFQASGPVAQTAFNVPAGATMVRVILDGAGGGGGSGRRGAAGAIRGGGGGGQGGDTIDVIIPLIHTAGTVTVLNYLLADGGNGGAAVTANDTNGNNGTNASDSWFGQGSLNATYVATGGKAGKGGTATTAYGGGRDPADLAGIGFTMRRTMSPFGLPGQATTNDEPAILGSPWMQLAPSVSQLQQFLCGGKNAPGGGGGGISAADAAVVPTNTSIPPGLNNPQTAWTSGTVGNSTTRTATAPTLLADSTAFTAIRRMDRHGIGGAGGYPGLGAAGGGGSIGIDGGGGAGGGASENGQSSGVGGKGGAARIVIMYW